MACKWGNILDVPIDAAIMAGLIRSILTHYGQVILDQVRAHATTYINAQTCVAQNNLMLYMFLAASITPEVKARAMIYHLDYHIGQNPSGVVFQDLHLGGSQ